MGVENTHLRYIRTTYLAYILGTLFGIHFSDSPSPNLSGIAYQVIEASKLGRPQKSVLEHIRMDITRFIVSQREKALLVGDYASYRKQLSRRLLVVRKKLHFTSTKSKKYAARHAVTAEDIARNHE